MLPYLICMLMFVLDIRISRQADFLEAAQFSEDLTVEVGGITNVVRVWSGSEQARSSLRRSG